MQGDAGPPLPTFGEAFSVWARIGILSFGGPAAQIALMHRMIVGERGWLNERQYLAALSFCMLLPGPEAMQLATYAGWRLHGLAGGLAAGLLFVLPGAAIVLALAAIYAAFGDVPLVDAVFVGIKAAVLVIVVEALVRVARRALNRADGWVIAALAFAVMFFLDVPFPLVIAAAALFGFLRGAGPETVAAETGPRAPLRGPAATLAVVAVWLVVWWAPVAVIALLSGPSILIAVGVFFSKLAVVTFGGAYAVLAYMAQQVAGDFGWLTAGEMLDGLGLAETTPGPLILVTEFVGYVAAYREGGVLLGLAGALVTLHVTFAPCFLWIFAGAPYVEWINAQPRLRSALTAITAAVVGVILNLSVWFALHVCFGTVATRRVGPLLLHQPELASLDWRVVALSALSAVLVFRLGWDIPRVLAVCAALGAASALIA